MVVQTSSRCPRCLYYFFDADSQHHHLELLLCWCWHAGLAEKKKEMEENAEFKRQQTKEYFKGLADMNRRVSRRKMLFEQATQDNLRRQVLEKFDEVRSAYFPGLFSLTGHSFALRCHSLCLQTLVQEGVGYLAETD